MSIDFIKDYLVPISTSISLIITAIGGWLALQEYRLKVKAETRLAESTQVESDIKLLTLFTQIMDIANARSGYYVSEKAIETILSHENFKSLNINENNFNALIENAVISLPVGAAAQEAAICAIWVLGKKHQLLMPIAIQALESLSKFKGETTKDYLIDLKNMSENTQTSKL